MAILFLRYSRFVDSVHRFLTGFLHKCLTVKPLNALNFLIESLDIACEGSQDMV